MQKAKIVFYLIITFTLASNNTLTGQESKLVSVKIECQSLKKSIFKIETKKELLIYLPPSYQISSKKYPVVYYLPGFNSPLEEFTNGTYEGFKLREDLDNLIQTQSLHEMIVVFCDGNNVFGGNFYSNSILTGNNEDYITKDVVSYIDSNFRSIPKASSRGISGNSMGGFGAITIAMKHPEIFSHCYALSPGIFDEKGLFNMNVFYSQEALSALDSLTKEVNSNSEKLKHLVHKMDSLYNEDRNSYFSAFTIAYGTAFCADTTLIFPHIAYPDTTTTFTNLNNKTFNSWQNGFGNWEQKVIQYKGNLLQLENIALDCGIHDGWITEGTLYLSNQLIKNKIPVNILWYDGGHTDKLHIRLKEHLFPYFSINFISSGNE